MTNLNPISDGQPLTYETINLMIGAINSLSPTEAAVNQVIEVTGGNIARSTDNVQMFVGEFFLSFGNIKNNKQSNASAQVKFGNRPFTATPYVFVTAVDPSNDAMADMSFISLTLIDITKSSFTCKGRRLWAGNDAVNKDKLKVNFLAIGPVAPQTT